MSELLRTAILGTGQVDDADADAAGSPADHLVERLGLADRERAILLRAGGHATLRRAGRLPEKQALSTDAAPVDTLPPTSPRLSAVLEALLDGSESDVLQEALERVARAGMRLSPELLPRALSSGWALRGSLRPVLGERGRWLARQYSEWAWAREAGAGETTLPPELDQRWTEGTSAERKALLTLVRRVDPARARQLVADGWKQEKVDQRLAWLELLEANLSAEDEPFLASTLADRSAQVRVAAARLLWRLPNSEVARRVRERAEGLLGLEQPGGMMAKLKSAVGGRPARTLRAALPPEKYDPAWEKEGILETPAHGGRRQFWLAQMIAAVPPTHWATRWDMAPAELVALARDHELGDALLDGLVSAAVRHAASDWYAPLWDAWTGASRRAVVSDDPESELVVRLAPLEAEPRLIKLLDVASKVALLSLVPGPWPEKLSRLVVSSLSELRREWTQVLPHAALAIPLEVLPSQVSMPVLPDENDYIARAYLRALERFQIIAALRQSVAREIAS